MSDFEYKFGAWILVAVTIIVVGLLAIAIIAANHTPIEDRANKTCASHGGVQSLDSGSDTVVCADNKARSI